jgi:hypothetical protein
MENALRILFYRGLREVVAMQNLAPYVTIQYTAKRSQL